MKCIRFVSPALAAAVIIGAAFAACSKDKGSKETPSTIVMEYVDLDLPSGLKWAERNLGASKPGDYGDCYAWGETKPKSDYSWANYDWSEEDVITKYNTDGKTTLAPEDDAAAKKLGSPWRMPTADEIQELLDNCDWIWTKQDGKNGYEVKGNNGNSIFLPAAGGRDGSELKDAGSLGYYWSSSLGTFRTDNARNLGFGSVVRGRGEASRFVGFSVRPVRP